MTVSGVLGADSISALGYFVDEQVFGLVTAADKPFNLAVSPQINSARIEV